METHGFRKAFQTIAIHNGMSPLYAEILMGHTSGGLALESYVKPTDNDLLEGNDKMIGYIGIIDALTTNDSHRLKRENQNLKSELSRFDTVLGELANIKQKLGLS
jgi:hypothetical protein